MSNPTREQLDYWQGLENFLTTGKPYDKVNFIDHVVDIETGEIVVQGTWLNRKVLGHMDEAIYNLSRSLLPTEEVATVTHSLADAPVCALYATEYAAGVQGAGEGPAGGGTVITVPARFELVDGRNVKIYTVPGFPGKPEVFKITDRKYALVFEDSLINLMVVLNDSTPADNGSEDWTKHDRDIAALQSQISQLQKSLDAKADAVTPITGDVKLYVSKQGSSSGDGTSQAPFAKIQQALDYANKALYSARRVDIIIGDGTYEECLTIAALPYVTLSSKSGDPTKVKLVGNDPQANYVISITGCSRVDVRDITVERLRTNAQYGNISAYASGSTGFNNVILNDNGEVKGQYGFVVGRGTLAVYECEINNCEWAFCSTQSGVCNATLNKGSGNNVAYRVDGGILTHASNRLNETRTEFNTNGGLIIPQTLEWKDLPLTEGFQPGGKPPQYCRDQYGLVHMRGQIDTSGQAGYVACDVPIAQLPTDCRPPYIHFCVASALSSIGAQNKTWGTPVTLVIGENGNLSRKNSWLEAEEQISGFIRLDGIIFDVKQ